MRFENLPRPVEKMLVATRLLVGLVWDLLTIFVMSSKCEFSYNVKYKHAVGLNCLLRPTLERQLCLSFTSTACSVQCIGVFCWRYHHGITFACAHKAIACAHNQSSGCLARVAPLD